MTQQIPISPEAIADLGREDEGAHEVAFDLAYLRLAMVNAVLYGRPHAGDRGWVLIDSGVAGLSSRIVSAAAARFGNDARPGAIILTHGHFDHIGSLESLAEHWDVSVFAHPAELPYLNGQASYPAPDSSVGGGLMPLLAPLFPRGPIDLGLRLKSLPADGAVPGMPGWKWLPTPGHSAGHVSLWRESDAAMIAGDAFITTNQESAYAVAVQAVELHGPPKYFTPDWQAAEHSVKMLAALEPDLVITGHGKAMRGVAMREALHNLADNFEKVAVPEDGKYVAAPANPESGMAYPAE
jgi:glyoxylase-like metal-dependent hydrolase (beta-lactamase superfamily II)